MEGGPRELLAQRAAQRHGVATVSEALELGLTRGQIRAAIDRGDWRRLATGVLVASGSPASWHQDCVITTLTAGGVLSHRAAARLHRLDGFADAPIELTVPMRRNGRTPGVTVHRSARLDRCDVLHVEGILATSIARTVVDLGAVVDADDVEKAVDDALRRGASLLWITHTMERLVRPGPTGTGALRIVLARADRSGPLADSAFERQLERLCVDAGLPQPQRQIAVLDASGDRVGLIDAGWPKIRLGIEAHSDRWHSGARRGRSDRTRDNRLAALGWELLYASWADVQQRDEFADLLRSAYAFRASRPEA